MLYQRVVLTGRIRCDKNQAESFEGGFNEFFSMRGMQIEGAPATLHGSDFQYSSGSLAFVVDAEIAEGSTFHNHGLESHFAKELRDAVIGLSQGSEFFRASAQAIETLEFKVAYATPWLFRLHCGEEGATGPRESGQAIRSLAPAIASLPVPSQFERETSFSHYINDEGNAFVRIEHDGPTECAGCRTPGGALHLPGCKHEVCPCCHEPLVESCECSTWVAKGKLGESVDVSWASTPNKQVRRK